MDAQTTRPGRWLWLATVSLATAGFIALSLNPVHAQEAPGPRLKTESPYFFVKSDDWEEITFPLAAIAGDRSMNSLVGRDGSCGSCHLTPTKDSADPNTGAAHDSPGVIIVDPTAPGAGCGGM